MVSSGLKQACGIEKSERRVERNLFERVHSLLETNGNAGVRTLRPLWLALALLLATAPLSGQAGSPKGGRKLAPLDIVQTAHTLFVQGNYEEAKRYYLEVLPVYPQSFDLLKNLAYCYMQSGPRGLAPAAQFYARAYAINPNSRDVAENLSKCYVALRRYAEAAAVLRKLAALSDAPAEAWKKVAEVYDLARRFPEAEKAYDVYLQRNPGDLEARSNLARIYSWEKNYAKALAEFRIVLATNPNFPPALIGMARVSSWQGRLEESLRLYERVLVTDPKNGEALAGKAFVLLWMGRFQDSQKLFGQLHQRYPHDAEIARGLQTATAAIEEKVSAVLRRGYTAEAEAEFRRALARDPKDLTALRALAEITATPQRCSEGIAFGRRALELSPNDPTLEFPLARALALCQQYSEAVARYRRFLGAQPKAEDALYELGDTLMRARRYAEAEAAFRDLLRANPNHSDGITALARALAATGDYPEALARYDLALTTSPDNYDALQGKAYVLLWTGQYAQSRTIFRSLAEKRPDDAQNAEALDNIARGEEEARWAAIRPGPDAPPQDFLRYYEKRRASYPDDKSALKGIAYIQAQLKNVKEAIEGYRRVVEKYPDDRDAQMELARLLSWDGQLDASVKIYRNVLASRPDDPDALENLARVYVWSKRDRDALEVYRNLLARNPSQTGYRLEVARLETRLKDYPAAREVLASVVLDEPQNRDARLQIAQLDLTERRWDESLRQFGYLLKQNPLDPDALMGRAQASYYSGNTLQAYAAASTLVKDRPDNFSAMFLLANIEHARGHRKRTLELLDRADQLSPGNADVLEMRKRIREESTLTLHTSASFAREIGPPTTCRNPAVGCGQLDLHEDLRTYSYGTTFGLPPLIPRTTSFLSLTVLPTSSPFGRNSEGGPAALGISGAVAPEQFLFRQTTRLTPRLTLRSGGGLMRFGPGRPLKVIAIGPGLAPILSPGLSRLESLDQDKLTAILGIVGVDKFRAALTRTALSRPVWIGGLSFAPWTKFGFDLDAVRSGVTSTPTSVRLGIMETRLGGNLNFFFNSRTEAHLGYFHSFFSSEPFAHIENSVAHGLRVEDRVEHVQLNGASALLNRNLVRSDRFSLDLGYSGVAFGHAGIRGENLFMGFFNPAWYNRNQATLRVYGKLSRAVSYDFSGGIGIQQPDRGRAVTRALNVTPALTFSISRRVSFSVGYTHYNTAEALGALRGDAFRLSTDWRL